MDISWDPVTDWLVDHGTRIFIILVIAAVLWLSLRRFLTPFVRRTMSRTMKGESEEAIRKRTDTLVSVLRWTAQVIITIVVVFMILSEVGISIAPALTTLGIAGVAFGFGAQYLVRDLIAGVFIILENQYRVDDWVNIAGIGGLVEDVGLRKTVLRDLDGVVHYVPNGEIRAASNLTRKFGRVNLNVSVAYGTDLDHAISVANRVGQELAEDDHWRGVILSTPKVLRVDKLGDSGIEIKILGDVKAMQQWAVMGELRLRLKKAFDAEGIEIPWPHTKIYFGDSPGDQSGKIS